MKLFDITLSMNFFAWKEGFDHVGDHADGHCFKVKAVSNRKPFECNAFFQDRYIIKDLLQILSFRQRNRVYGRRCLHLRNLRRYLCG